MKLDIRVLRGFLALGLLHHDRVVLTYLSLAPQYINQIEQAAHALKSSVANIGAEILSGFCMQLEELGHGNQFMWQLYCFLRCAVSRSSINCPAESLKEI